MCSPRTLSLNVLRHAAGVDHSSAPLVAFGGIEDLTDQLDLCNLTLDVVSQRIHFSYILFRAVCESDNIGIETDRPRAAFDMGWG